MKNIGREIYTALLSAWDGCWTVWIANLFWLLFCLPVVTMPLAFAGLYHTMRELAYGESVTWKTFFEGIQLRWKIGLRWVTFNLLVIFVLSFYTWFFSVSKGDFGALWGSLFSGLPVGLLAGWGLMNAFTFPLMLEQEKPSYSQALKNSLVMVVKWPAFWLGFGLCILGVLMLSFWLRFPWLVCGASLPAFLGCVAVKNKVAETLKTTPDLVRSK